MSERNDTRDAVADDWLERALAEDGRDHRADYLADDGFTARVAAALPAPMGLPAWRKPAVVLLWTIGALGVALALPGAFADVASAVVRLLGRQPISLAGVAIGLATLGMASWAGAVYALRRDD
jgi:hypothetical protein